MLGLERARWFCLSAAALAGGILFSNPAAGEPLRARPAELAARAVSEAQQREIYGLAGDREELLKAAAELAPDYAPLRWQLGHVRGLRGWIPATDILQTPKLAERLAQYERQRDEAADTVEGQWTLAQWCGQHKLLDQRRAHLTRVIDLDSDHAAARAALGFIRQRGAWVAREQIAREAAQESAAEAALFEWQPKLEAIRKDLEHSSQKRRDFGAAQLAAIVDPAAIPAIEAVFADAPAPLAVAAFDTLLGIDDPDAALALSRFAVYSPDLPIRQAAAERLGQRDFDSFVPVLLASMYSPVVSQFMAVNMPNGRINYRHAFVREAQDQRELLVLDTEYRRVSQVGGSRRDSQARAFDEAADTARALEQRAAAQNEFTNRLNDRIAWVLKIATNEDLPAQPEDWWHWWNERNEVFVSEKTTALIQQSRQVAIVDRVAEFSSGGGSGTHDCLAAGTGVWTARGLLAIEQIQVGDLVLSQHPETGELAYKPVLRTTVRPKSPLVRIEAGGETLTTSGGHPLWVAGTGWVKARELKSGQVLHTANGPLHISAVEPGQTAETYNLVVADFRTYFVGYAKVLSHDNTVRQPTSALVPGLIAN